MLEYKGRYVLPTNDFNTLCSERIWAVIAIIRRSEERRRFRRGRRRLDRSGRFRSWNAGKRRPSHMRLLAITKVPLNSASAGSSPSTGGPKRAKFFGAGGTVEGGGARSATVTAGRPGFVAATNESGLQRIEIRYRKENTLERRAILRRHRGRQATKQHSAWTSRQQVRALRQWKSQASRALR